MNLRRLMFEAISTPTHWSGLSLLHAYCIMGDFESVRLILACSPSRLDNAIALTITAACSRTDHTGKTAAEITEAFSHDSTPHRKILQLLGDVAKPYISRSLLHVAVRSGTYDHVRWLLKLGANVNEVRIDWNTLLSHDKLIF